MKEEDIHRVMNILREEVKKFNLSWVTEVGKRSRDPFQVLISCILSLRTRDEVTGKAIQRLFSLGSTPEKLLEMSEERIREAIYPVGFYRNKAKIIRRLCKILIKEYNSRVPTTLEELLKLKGVGRKTANLVLTLGYGKPGIGVDTHVHRIVNRWGYVNTRTPEESEFALRKKLPPEYWTKFNTLLVAFGQRICRPISPRCFLCPLRERCDFYLTGRKGKVYSRRGLKRRSKG